MLPTSASMMDMNPSNIACQWATWDGTSNNFAMPPIPLTTAASLPQTDIDEQDESYQTANRWLYGAELLLTQYYCSRIFPDAERDELITQLLRIVGQTRNLLTMSNSPEGNSADRSRLTDDQKKRNHIISEQKRRQAIRAGFDQLANLIPGLQGQGRSEAVVLEASVKLIEKENKRKEKLWQRVEATGRMTRAEFDAHYAVHSANDAAAQQNTAPSGTDS